MEGIIERESKGDVGRKTHTIGFIIKLGGVKIILLIDRQQKQLVLRGHPI